MSRRHRGGLDHDRRVRTHLAGYGSAVPAISDIDPGAARIGRDLRLPRVVPGRTDRSLTSPAHRRAALAVGTGPNDAIPTATTAAKTSTCRRMLPPLGDVSRRYPPDLRGASCPVASSVGGPLARAVTAEAEARWRRRLSTRGSSLKIAPPRNVPPGSRCTLTMSLDRTGIGRGRQDLEALGSCHPAEHNRRIKSAGWRSHGRRR